jgi:hypothetical protein
MEDTTATATCDLAQLSSSADLRDSINGIRQMHTTGRTLQEIRDTHTTFCQRYPKLVDKLTEDDMNAEQLEYILSMFDKVKDSQTTFTQASHKIGNDMFDKYVAPELNDEQLARVRSRIRDLQTHTPEELAQAAASLGQPQPSGYGSVTPTTRGAGATGNAKKLRKRPKKKVERNAK